MVAAIGQTRFGGPYNRGVMRGERESSIDNSSAQVPSLRNRPVSCLTGSLLCSHSRKK